MPFDKGEKEFLVRPSMWCIFLTPFAKAHHQKKKAAFINHSDAEEHIPNILLRHRSTTQFNLLIQSQLIVLDLARLDHARNALLPLHLLLSLALGLCLAVLGEHLRIVARELLQADEEIT